MSTGRLGAGDTAIQPTIFDAKGDLLTATAGDTPARIAVGSNGQYLKADSTTATGLAWATLPASGKVLQVVSTAKTDSFTTTSTTFVDITGLSVSITPLFSTSKILVTATYQDTVTDSQTGFARLMRDTTAIAIGDTSGSRQRVTTVARGLNNNSIATHSIMFLDSPATTSATTYKMQAAVENVGGTTYYLNQASLNNDNASRGVTASTITVMEIGA